MSRTRPSLLLTLLAAWLLFACGCRATSHEVERESPRAPDAASSMRALLAIPGPITLTAITAADWAVPLSGLLDLSDPRAKKAGLTDHDEPIQITLYVLEHPTHGRYLIDSGVARAFRDRESAPVSKLIASQLNFDALQVRTDTATWLAQPDHEIQGVLLTHLHLDHAMGIPDLPVKTPIYTGANEAGQRHMMYMFTRGDLNDWLEDRPPLKELTFSPDPSGAFDGVIDFFGDGSLFLLATPGHTSGSMAMVVRTPQGPHLIVGDTSHTDWGWNHCVTPGSYTHDHEANVKSLRALRALADGTDGITVHVGHQRHDPDATQEPCR